MSAAEGERAPTFGQELARLRLAAGMSQHDLADASGVKRSNISMLEVTEDAQPASATLFALSAALGVTSEHFRVYFPSSSPPPSPPPPRGKLK